jgi:myo-inositol 2-dehydrogenase/D-chiro-inositol 1-dehydrogenase
VSIKFVSKLKEVLICFLNDSLICSVILFSCVLAAAQYNVPRFTSDAMDVITDPEVDAVWICSPSSFHAEQIKACAANGKHVFCEKPIATDLPETVEAINACAEAGVKIMIGLQRRFDQNFKRVQEACANKEVGDTIQVSTF